jgi:Asp-tRNA(Asn)/Glu-tRNA(Gln) amidotransferase B subunit
MLRDLLRALGVSRRPHEQGSLRRDANVSLRPIGTSTFGTRTETKNVNSLRSVERAAVQRSLGRRPYSPAAAGSSRRPATGRRIPA